MPDGGSAQPAHLRDDARTVGDDIEACLRLAEQVGRELPLPGSGHTYRRWTMLAAVAEGDLTAARVLEAHSDALAILAEAEDDGPRSGTWGVFAAEAPPVRLDAIEDEHGTWLVGTKPWCSLGGRLDRALITAHTAEGDRRLYAVDLRDSTVTADPPDGWIARGLTKVTSGPLHFDHTPARPVGAPGWYLVRTGFAWGGIGVAACWYGGARGLYRTLLETVRNSPSEIRRLQVGAVDVALHAADAALRVAAERLDAGEPDASAAAVLALRVRSVVADAVETTLRYVGHALGPAPLAFDDRHARRVADLELYVRQHHGERDLAALGAAVLEGGDG